MKIEYYPIKYRNNTLNDLLVNTLQIKNLLDIFDLTVYDKYKTRLDYEEKLINDLNKVIQDNKKSENLLNLLQENEIKKKELQKSILLNLKILLSKLSFLPTKKKEYFIELVDKIDSMTKTQLERQNSKLKDILDKL